MDIIKRVNEFVAEMEWSKQSILRSMRRHKGYALDFAKRGDILNAEREYLLAEQRRQDALRIIRNYSYLYKLLTSEEKVRFESEAAVEDSDFYLVLMPIPTDTTVTGKGEVNNG